MIKQILIEEGGLSKSNLEFFKIADEYVERHHEGVTVIPVQRIVKDFSGKMYYITAICDDYLDKEQIERIKLFLESFAIDYQHKLLNLNFCVFENMNL